MWVRCEAWGSIAAPGTKVTPLRTASVISSLSSGGTSSVSHRCPPWGESVSTGGDALQVALDRFHQRVAADAVELARPLDVGRVLAVGEEARQGELGHRRAVHVVGALLDEDPLLDGPAGGHPADAQPAADRLRERVDVDDVALRVRPKRAGVVPLEAEVAVDAVLDDEEAVPASELQQAGAPGRREVHAGRVVAARLDRQEADLLAAEQRLEGVDVEALGVVSAPGSRGSRSTSPTRSRP